MECMELMQRVHAGDGEAFKALYAHYSEVVYRVAYQELGDQEAALQVVKSVFRTVYQTLRERGPIEGDFYGWLDAQAARELRRRAQELRTEIPPAPTPVFEQRPGAAPAAPRKVAPTPAPPPRAAAAPPPRTHRYTPQEARAIEARAQARLTHAPQEEEPEPAPMRAGSVLAIIGGTAVCLVLLWTLIGLLMRLNVLPWFDLGYAWFDETLFPLFQ